jgi:acetyl-CoA synthetase
MTLQISSFDEYQEVYKRSVEDPEGFWAEQASTFQWRKKWDKVLDWNFREPNVNWFVGGKLNITENCLDRHLETRGDQVAILFEPNDPDDPVKEYTYKQLHAEVCKVANALRANGIKKGDRICFYMPMVPELAIAVLACARIGAVHSVVFAGFSAQALADRINDASCNMVICSDYNKRGSKLIPVKKIVDDAMALGCESIETILVHQNTGGDVEMVDGRDKWWHTEVDGQSTTCEAEENGCRRYVIHIIYFWFYW